MGKPTICICENKGADQLRGNREADQRLCFRYSDSTIPLLLTAKLISAFVFATRIVQFLFYLNPKFQASSSFLLLCRTCSETTLLVFPRGGSNVAFKESKSIKDMSHLVGKPTMWFPNRSDTNRPVQLQKQAGSLKFWIYLEEDLYYPSSENKGADQLRGYREADQHLCFRLCRLLVFPWGGSYVKNKNKQVERPLNA